MCISSYLSPICLYIPFPHRLCVVFNFTIYKLFFYFFSGKLPLNKIRSVFIFRFFLDKSIFLLFLLGLSLSLCKSVSRQVSLLSLITICSHSHTFLSNCFPCFSLGVHYSLLFLLLIKSEHVFALQLRDIDSNANLTFVVPSYAC